MRRIYDDAVFNEVVPVERARIELLDVLFSEKRLAVLHDDERADAATLAGLKEDAVDSLIVHDVEIVRYLAQTAFSKQVRRELLRVLDGAYELGINEDICHDCHLRCCAPAAGPSS